MMRRRREGVNVEVAFNTTPWEPFPAPKGENRADPIGWCVTDGEEVSHSEGGEWVFAIRRDACAEILQVKPGEGPDFPDFSNILDFPTLKTRLSKLEPN